LPRWSASYLDDVRADLRGGGVIRAVRDHNTPALFDLKQAKTLLDELQG